MNWFRSHTLGALGAIFLIVGVPFLIIGIVTVISTLNFLQGAQKTSGTVAAIISYTDSDGDLLYKPKVIFTTLDGKQIEYVPNTGSNPSTHREGDTIAVYYKAANPQNAKIDSFMDLWFLSLIFGILGAIFSGIGGGIVVFRLRAGKNKQWLLSHGYKVLADFTSVADSMIEVNGEHGKNIVCQWMNPRDNKIYVFRSEDLWIDPQPFIKDKQIPVMIDPANPHKYFVDTSFLPRSG